MKTGERVTVVDKPVSLTLLGWEGQAAEIIEVLSPSIVMLQFDSVEGRIGQRQALVEDLERVQRRLL